MSTLDDIRQTFFQECDDLLEALDDGLQIVSDALEARDVIDTETVNAVFRAVHSIKGGAAAFSLDHLVRFAHQFETALDDVRAVRLNLTDDVLAVFLRAADQLADLVSAARDNRDPPTDTVDQISARLAALAVRAPDDAPEQEAATSPQISDLAFEPMSLDLTFETTPMVLGEVKYRIDFRAHRQLFSNGSDPVHLFRELATLGAIEVTTDVSDVPDIDSIDPGHCNLGWTLILATREPLPTLWEVFDFVEGLCALDITELPEAGQSDFAAEVAPGYGASAKDANAAKPDEQDAARTGRPQAGAKSTGAKATVRVDLDHVDRMINVVGELVINQSVLTQCIMAANIPLTTTLSSSLDEFMALAREIQEGVMAIRAQSVKPLFQRMARIAREAGDIAGKSLRFETEGEATEVDKTVIERLVDPLTHIIRNSVDHGLEHPQTRLGAGKPETGKLTLRAAHRSGRVVIEVSDDGAGINRPRVLDIAIKKGLVAPDAVLANSEIDKLLFMPGFSTAHTVTDLSGRGVGMDVVRSEVQKLGGRISITSEAGAGTTISISLPLTLAVLDGMVVDVSGHTMVVPITTIVETIRAKAADIHMLNGGAEVVSVRDRFIPIIDLGRVFGFRPLGVDLTNLVFLRVESDHDKLWALAVDHIHDQRQVVIKGLESNYGHIPGVAAATILGDGKVALIIDPEEAALRTALDPIPAPYLEET